jgi:MinD-like ATPase involved in chromosome partitioning or flagellar assembly
VLGHLQKLSGTTVDMHQLWHDKNGQTALTAQRELLRSLRYEILKEMNGQKVLCISALRSKQGTSFTALNLAYAFSTMHKRVLLIDGNFRNPSISEIVPPALSVNDLFNTSFAPSDNTFITAGSLSETCSPFEIANQQQIYSALHQLPFDLVLIDTGDLANDNNTKEWIACSDKIVCVFENGQPLTADDETIIEWLQQDKKFVGWVFNKYGKA